MREADEDRVRVAGLLSQLWQLSNRVGERALTDALRDCAIGVHAAVLDCPLGAVILEEYGAQHGRAVRPADDLDPTGVGLAIDACLEGQAAALDDPVLIEAVTRCARSKRMGSACPLYPLEHPAEPASRLGV